MKLTKKSLALITAGVIGLGAVTAPLVADGPRNCGGKHGGYAMMGGHGFGKDTDRMIGKMARKLDMTDEQRDQAFAIADKYRPQVREAKFAMRENMQSLHELDPAATDYTQKTESLADQQGDLIADTIKLRTAMQAELEQILTAEQKEKFEKFKRKHQRRHHDHDNDEAEQQS